MNFPRPDVRGREPPLGEIARRVRQRPVEQVHGVRARVVNLNPVLMRPVLVEQPRDVAGDELGDDDVVGGAQRRRREEGAEQQEKLLHGVRSGKSAGLNKRAPVHGWTRFVVGSDTASLKQFW